MVGEAVPGHTQQCLQPAPRPPTRRHAACTPLARWNLGTVLLGNRFVGSTNRSLARPTGRKMGVRRRGGVVCRVFAACNPNRKKPGRPPSRSRFGTQRLILVRSDSGSDYPATVRLFRLFPTEATIARLLGLVLFRYPSNRPHGSPDQSRRQTIVRSIISNVISLLKTGKSVSP